MKYIEYGKENSEVIMMLHGGGLSWWNYRKEAELLCDEYHVSVKFYEANGFKADESLVFMAADV